MVQSRPLDDDQQKASAKGVQLAALTAEATHGVTGVASFILLPNIGNQMLCDFANEIAEQSFTSPLG